MSMTTSTHMSIRFRQSVMITPESTAFMIITTSNTKKSLIIISINKGVEEWNDRKGK
jgi:hypothetical protein